MSSELFNPIASNAPLIVYIDYKSPYAYLAVDPTYALGEELGIEIDWRPLTLDIASYLGSARLSHEGKVVEERRSAGQWTKVKYAYHDVRRYGSLRGLVIRGTVKIWDSALAGIGMLWAKQQGQTVLRAYSSMVYERFWKRELDLENPEAIEGILTASGARTEGFRDYASGQGRELNDKMQRSIFDAGIFGVPTYVIDGELFFGREHLPHIRWMLTGRKGQSPDIAYEPNPVALVRTSENLKSGLGVAIDFKSPQAYLAVGPTCALADEIGIAIDWQPLLVNPPRTAPAVSGDDRGARHRRVRADYLERDIERYAADRGLTLAESGWRKDSTLAAVGLLWAKRQDPTHARRYVERVFERHWRGELDIEDERSIGAVLTEIGAPLLGFGSFVAGEGREELARIQNELRERGLFEVPTYLVNDDVFLGRQHLPTIRSLLSAGQDDHQKRR